ncbi:hypothetical protein SDC9_110684 [bioreactor metagenome]|uniref:Uncharacterized protein n=1 Tax=bioreactor metagenome TaxID=1076179 RepID=A0A645BEC8_9ZZZZ
MEKVDVYMSREIQYRCVILVSSFISFSSIPPFFMIVLAEAMFCLSHVSSAFVIPKFRVIGSAKASI